MKQEKHFKLGIHWQTLYGRATSKKDVVVSENKSAVLKATLFKFRGEIWDKIPKRSHKIRSLSSKFSGK
jgi:hypothetical protein